MTYSTGQGQVARLRPLPVVRWLGVFFDPQLTFRAHVEKACAKARKAAMAMRMLANTVRGLHQGHMRRLYIACIRPILIYASAVWWSGAKWQEEQMGRVQNLCLRMICAVFKTSPIYALEIEVAIPPIAKVLDKVDRDTAARLHKLGPRSPVLQRLPPLWTNHREVGEGAPVEHDQVITFSTLRQLALLTSRRNERILPFHLAPWAVPLVKEFPGRVHLRLCPKKVNKAKAAQEHIALVERLQLSDSNLIFYTDGSLLETGTGRSTGPGFVAYLGGQEEATGRIPMGAKSEVYDAEMHALSAAMGHLQHMDIQLGTCTHLHFFADNSSSVGAILQERPGPAQHFSITFCELAREFLVSDASHEVTVSWVPSHIGIRGNERADQLAKEAAHMPGPRWATYAYLRRRSKEGVLESWLEDFAESPPRGL